MIAAGYAADQNLARTVEGIDLIVGGHSHSFLYTGNPPLKVRADNICESHKVEGRNHLPPGAVPMPLKGRTPDPRRTLHPPVANAAADITVPPASTLHDGR